ncbi:hypothetical protein RFI_10124 [Reticulomyxa filosa]|uniref:Protein kinase domain-containing protein n=1 Tax=Reticulomyxa filosa TaxID=46433 RepID=X6NNQ5_RETFI|nr:hypothetical protein RFI_10124 [Reticulomyxa filosa]|eukprot:ETO27007.1 hypothetical protein RFI_10124 [Reticulomyxa filosa]
MQLLFLNHSNIVKVIEILDTPRHLYIILELLTGGELFDRIVALGHFSEQEAAHITSQLAQALKYLHSQFIAHRDLKPENVLFETKDSNTVKITDFGLAKSYGVLSEGKKHYLETTCGTPSYVAPEILKQKQYREPVDMWSLGVITYIMLCGSPPFGSAQNVKAMYRKIKKGEFSFSSPAWSNISLLAKDCIRSLLDVNPKSRLRAEELCEHPWIKSHHLQSSLNIVNQGYSRNLQMYTYKKRLRVNITIQSVHAKRDGPRKHFPKITFSSYLKKKKKIYRGVELIITLNRMIRAAGLEEVAKRQRDQFRKRLKPYKQKLKSEQKALKKALANNDYETANSLKHVEYYPYDDTPPIDYSQV